jgi:hypothetical protein
MRVTPVVGRGRGLQTVGNGPSRPAKTAAQNTALNSHCDVDFLDYPQMPVQDRFSHPSLGNLAPQQLGLGESRAAQGK